MESNVHATAAAAVLGRRACKAVAITGANGYVGRLLVKRLAQAPGPLETILAIDNRPTYDWDRVERVTHATADIRSKEAMAELLTEHGIECVVHLAWIVDGREVPREVQYQVNVEGTENLLQASLNPASAIVVTSSGAAYGYHPDGPEWLDEAQPLRGNEAFAYSDHKRLVEEMLARYREAHPELRQLIFRPGTILGRGTRNQITALFEKPMVMGFRGVSTPFVFIWDEDLVSCIEKGVSEGSEGIYNLAGDGIMTLRDIAARMGKRYVPLPLEVVKPALGVMKLLGLTRYGPEQVLFLKHRPVLSNDRLKEAFGYVPRKTTRQVFDTYWQNR